MTKQIGWVALWSLAIAITPPSVMAIAIEHIPNPRKINGSWVSDTANILSPATEGKLNEMISALESKNGAELAIVTVEKITSPQPPKQFATSLFNYWKIGKTKRNSGALLFISKRDRRVEILTGKGVREVLSDDRASKIIQQEITPRFKQQDYEGGTLAGTNAIVARLEALNESQVISQSGQTKIGYHPNPWLGLLILTLPVGMMATVVSLLVKLRKAKTDVTKI